MFEMLNACKSWVNNYNGYNPVSIHISCILFYIIIIVVNLCFYNTYKKNNFYYLLKKATLDSSTETWLWQTASDSNGENRHVKHS